MIKQLTPLLIRNDEAGLGHFGAPRGSRTHHGIDYVCTPGHDVASPVNGTLTKYGYPYGDDLSWRYVEITCDDGYRHRLFYVEPLTTLSLGDFVTVDDAIGVAQDITQRYPGQGMTPHVHYEVKDADGGFVNPENLP